MPPVATEKRRALRYKPAVAVRAAYQWFDAVPMSIDGAITDFSVAGVALQYADSCGQPDLADRGRLVLRLGYETEHFDVTLVRLMRNSGGHWLAGFSFVKSKESRSRAHAVIEHLTAAYRAGAVQANETEVGQVATVVGNLNFNVVVNLHRMLRAPQPPRLIDLDQCTGADYSGIEFLMLARERGVNLKLDSSGRIAGLIQRQCAIRQLAAEQATRYALERSR